MTQQALWCQTVTIWTNFSIHIKQSWKILIMLLHPLFRLTGWPYFSKIFLWNAVKTGIKSSFLMKSALFWHKYTDQWKFAKVPLRTFIIFFNNSGLWKILLGFWARYLFSRPALKILHTQLQYYMSRLSGRLYTTTGSNQTFSAHYSEYQWRNYLSHDTTKLVFGSFRPGQAQTGLLSHRS